MKPCGDLAVHSEIHSHPNAQISAFPDPEEIYQLAQTVAQCAVCVFTRVYMMCTQECGCCLRAHTHVLCKHRVCVLCAQVCELLCDTV